MKLTIPGRDGRWTPEMRGTKDPFDVPYVFTTETEKAVEIIKGLGPAKIAMDTETVYREGIVDPLTAKLRVISIATEDSNGDDIAYVLDVKDMDPYALGQAMRDRAAELGERRLEVQGFNANFDDPVTTLNLTEQTLGSGYGYRPLLNWVDLMFAVSVQRLGAFGHSWPSLAKAAERYLGVDMTGKGGVQLSYDAHTPLTEEQIAYAAQDAVVTLWLGDAVRDALIEKNLIEAFSLETSARPFLSSMTINGLAFDQAGWEQHLEEVARQTDEIVGKIATMTGGQPTLFGPPVPSFNLDSPDGLRKALNKHCPDLVEEFLIQREGDENRNLKRPNTFQPYDSVDKTTIKLMKVYGDRLEKDTELLDLLLQYSAVSKIRSTYGEKMMKLLRDGRFHAEFTQCLIATGRTSSSKPNAQNFSPLMKKYFTPTPRVDENGVEHRRVLLHADYSQAELRVSAQLTGEPVRKEAFAADEDQHAAVAGQMFQVDMKELLKTEEGAVRYKNFRGKAKTLNFGLGYGMREQLLADTLTQQGILTTKEEGAKLMRDFFDGLPVEAKWLEARDQKVHRLANDVKLGLESGTRIDFDLSFRLLNLLEMISEMSTSLKNSGQPINPESIATHYLRSQGSEMDQEKVDSLVQLIQWARQYDGAVVLRQDGSPWEFYSTTIAKRRRIFQVPVKFLIEAVSLQLATPKTPEWQARVDLWAANNQVTLAHNPHTFNEDGTPIYSRNRKPFTFSELRKRFEKIGPKLRKQFVFDMLALLKQGEPVAVSRTAPLMPPHEAQLRRAMSQQIGRLANAYRNAPIQGSVADGVLRAFAELFDLFEDYPTTAPVTTVHDSIVVECDIEDAPKLAVLMKERMEAALAAYVPDIKVVADIDVLSSLDEKAGAIPEEELQAWAEAPAAA